MNRFLRPCSFHRRSRTDPPRRRPDTAHPGLAGQSPPAPAGARHSGAAGRCRAGDTGAGARAAGSPPRPVPLPTWFTEIDTAKKGEVTPRGLPEVPHEDVRAARHQQGRQAHGRGVPQGRRAALHAPMARARRRSRSAAPAPAPSSRTSTPTATASSSAPRPRRWCMPNSTSTTWTATTRSPSPSCAWSCSARCGARSRRAARSEARRRQGMVAINEFIDMQLRRADQLDKNNDGKVSQQEYAALAGPADGPQAQGLPPFELRTQDRDAASSPRSTPTRTASSTASS